MARGRVPKSTMFFTKESTKQHDFCTMQEERTKNHNLLHEGGHQKARSRARFLARGRAPKSTFVSKGKHQKAQFLHDARRSAPKHNLLHEGGHQKARSKARFLARGRAPKSKENNTKKHDRESRTRLLARGKAPKSNVFLQEGKHSSFDLRQTQAVSLSINLTLHSC